MILLFVLILIVLIGLTAAAVTGKIGGFLADPTSTHAFSGVPTEGLSSGDVAQLHFDHGLRGYRMDQVDAVVDALAGRLRELESAVASPTGSAPDGDPAPPTHTAAASPQSAGASDVSGEPAEH